MSHLLYEYMIFFPFLRKKCGKIVDGLLLQEMVYHLDDDAVMFLVY